MRVVTLVGPGPAGSSERGRAREMTSPRIGEAGVYFQEASANISCVSGLTFGGWTSEEKTIEGGELEMGSPGRTSITISLSSW